MKWLTPMSVFAFLFASALSQSVPELNQSQYLGRWYQVYSNLVVDITFENSSYCDTADYGLNSNGTISVLNRERKYGPDGPERLIYGWADQDSSKEPGQLTVHLQTVEFGAPYWVYELGPATYNGSQYQYSVVSDPFELTLFVLARNITSFLNTWAQGVLQRLEAEGFTGFYNAPVLTPQTNCTYW